MTCLISPCADECTSTGRANDSQFFFLLFLPCVKVMLCLLTSDSGRNFAATILTALNTSYLNRPYERVNLETCCQDPMIFKSCRIRLVPLVQLNATCGYR